MIVCEPTELVPVHWTVMGARIFILKYCDRLKDMDMVFVLPETRPSNIPLMESERRDMVAGDWIDAVAEMIAFFVMNEYSTGEYVHFNMPLTNSDVVNVAFTVVEVVFCHATALYVDVWR